MQGEVQERNFTMVTPSCHPRFTIVSEYTCVATRWRHTLKCRLLKWNSWQELRVKVERKWTVLKKMLLKLWELHDWEVIQIEWYSQKCIECIRRMGGRIMLGIGVLLNYKCVGKWDPVELRKRRHLWTAKWRRVIVLFPEIHGEFLRSCALFIDHTVVIY
jgi:hypothetical protein